MNSVVRLVTPGGVERRVESSDGSGPQLKVILERVKGVGVVGGNSSRMRASGMLHGHGAPALTVINVTIPEDRVRNGGGC